MPDLPRRRGANPSWMQPIAARLTPAIKALVVVNTLVFFLYVLVHPAQEPMLELLTVGPEMLRRPWQPLTAMFIHVEWLGLLLNIVGLWFVGAFIERTQGTRRFLTLFFVSGVLANVATGLVAHVYGARGLYAGTSAAVLALFVAFARIYGPVPTQVFGTLYLKATHLAMIFVGWALVADLLRRDLASVAGTIVVSISGYLLAAPGGLKQLVDGWRARRARQRYKVLDGGAPRRVKARGGHKYWN